MASGFQAMRRVSIRNILAHKVRLVLTVLAVTLGTAFIAGSFMFTASLSSAFDSIATDTVGSVDAIVSADKDKGGALPPDTDKQLRDRPDVAAVNSAQQKMVVLARQDGTAIQTGGAPSVLSPWYPPGDSVGSPTPMAEGKNPQGPSEVVINDSAAQQHNVHVGDKMLMVDPQGRHEVTISGIYHVDLAGGGFLRLGMEAQAFQQTVMHGIPADSYHLRAKQGTSSDQLVQSLSTDYPNAKVETGKAAADKLTKDIRKALSFVNYFLIAFGLIALLVGTFIIANTFSMIVTQRTKEFALLRALGVSRRQLTVSVVFEAVVIGIVGSLVGVLAGIGLVRIIRTVLEATGSGLPAGGIGLTPASVIIPLILGVIVTVASAWAPARKAGAIHPVEAMRSGDASRQDSLRGRTIFGGIFLAIGAVAVISGVQLKDWETSSRAILVGVGALLMILGTFLVSPALSRVIVPGIGWVIGAPFGAVGKLARTNSQRSPRRTATTAFALTLGVMLVTTIGMLGATMKSSVGDMTNESALWDYRVTAPENGQFPIPNQAIDDLHGIKGIGEMEEYGLAEVQLGKPVTGMPPGTSFYGDNDPSKFERLTVTGGSLDLTKPGFIADTATAEKSGWKIGQKAPMKIRQTTVELPLLGTYEKTPSTGPVIISKAALEPLRAPGQPLSTDGAVRPLFALVKAAPGSSRDKSSELRSELEKAMKPYIVVQVMDPTEFSGQSGKTIDQMLNILYGLLGLAIVVAILGIINTLALNVIERRQEVGMLRAIGTQRKQIRWVITLEAVQIAVYGALLGVGIGLFLGWAFIKVLSGEGLGTVVYPWGEVAAMMIGSAIIGVIAALWPAVRASRTPPLDAIAE